MNKVIGTCGSCGGQVLIPNLWGGVEPPIPQCSRCGRQAANHGPVIPMQDNPSAPLDLTGVEFELMGTGKIDFNQ